MKDNDIIFLLKHRNGSESEVLVKMKNTLTDMKIPSDTVENVLNSDVTKEFLGKYIFQTLNAYFYNQEEHVITKEDVIWLIEQNIPVIENFFLKQHQNWTEIEREQLLTFVNEHAYKIVELLLTMNEIICKIENKIAFDGFIPIIKQSFIFCNNLVVMFIFIFLLCIDMGFIVYFCYKENKYLKILKKILAIYVAFFIFIEVLLGTVIKDYFMNEWQLANVFINYMVNVLAKNLWIFILACIILQFILAKIINRKEEMQCEDI